MSIQFFLRFAQLEHLKQLLYSGHIFIKRGTFFKQDSPNLRFDKNEGKLSISHVTDTFIEIRPEGGAEWKKLYVKKGVFEQALSLNYSYVYSLFSILESETRQNEFFEFSQDVKKMGEYYILIHNPREFMTRMVSGLEKTPYYYEHGIVNYYDPNENHNRLGLFYKEARYQHQKEYRIVISINPEISSSPENIEFDIGNLEDIAEICQTDHYNGLKFRWE